MHNPYPGMAHIILTLIHSKPFLNISEDKIEWGFTINFLPPIPP